MNATALIFLLVCGGSILALPRRHAPIPLLAACCYMTLGQGVELGSISLPIFRLVLAAGLLRVLMRRESMVGRWNGVDKLVIVWSAWMVFASFFHERIPGSGPTYTLGFVIDIASIYFLTRVWSNEVSKVDGLLRVMAWLLVPVALAMVAEHILQRNAFSIFGGIPDGVYVRDGKIRAQGPFLHPILAGTVGAACVPLMTAIWGNYRLSATVGLTASIAMVFASTSSGPLMSLMFGVFAIALWLRRSWLPAVRWGAVVAYIGLEIIMSRPAYYLMSMIDLTGSSTSWYRSRLIESAFERLSEWWLFGTDRTFHWMPNPLTERHSDITNYYILVGVMGGLLAMILLVAIFWLSFIFVGRAIRTSSTDVNGDFVIWCLGAGLFSHAITGISVAYFDQSMAFIWLNVGLISSLYSLTACAGSDPTQRTSKDRGAIRIAGHTSPYAKARRVSQKSRRYLVNTQSAMPRPLLR